MTQEIEPRFAAWPAEVAQLLSLAEETKYDYIVEIGCYLGCTTSKLAAYARATNKKVIAIDPWDDRQDRANEAIYQQFLNNTSEWADRITVIRKPSVDAADCLPTTCEGNIGLVFIDGCHFHPAPLQDIEAFYNKVGIGGYIALHDVFDLCAETHVKQALAEFPHAKEVQYLKYLPTEKEKLDFKHGVSGLAWFRKTNA